MKTIVLTLFSLPLFAQVTPDSINIVKKDTINAQKLSSIDEVVLSGTLKPVRKLDSPVPVEVYSPVFFKRNPTPNIFEALQNVNGIRPQINCNVCNTGDIHINGLEGPYTMVLIDGMPIVSSLGTVYGLSGIPNSLVERIEVVKGPASSLYGSEAVGGLINIITKNALTAPRFSADVFSTTLGEYNVDLGMRSTVGNIYGLTGVNFFTYQNKIDQNHDNFTDATLQSRISIFQKFNIKRPSGKLFSLAARYLYEDRWGGEMNWNTSCRGGNVVYGESIYTSRGEILGAFQLPTRENLTLSFSLIGHWQDSRYGTTSYIANQKIGFGQLVWDKTIKKHDLLAGLAFRNAYYDDNTPGTADSNSDNAPGITRLPGIFLQDDIKFSERHRLLLGMRWDHHNVHGNIFTPRLAYKWSVGQDASLRLNAGTGFRVVNLFTEDHAALTGAREVVIKNELNPEKSYNGSINFEKKFRVGDNAIWHFETSGFYTHFTNRIVADYSADNNKIIYDNLSGYAVSKGISISNDITFGSGIKVNIGATLMDNTITENGETKPQLLSEHFTGTWSVSVPLKNRKLSVDYTGNIYSPMHLPLAGGLDPRPAQSPWWSIQNIQLTYDGMKNLEIYGGVKNLLNFLPYKKLPFLIARAYDPFDKNVIFDSNGNAVATPDNPYALTFDPAYVYAPNQGIRGFLGIRYTFK